MLNSMAIVVATHAVPKNLEGERARTDSAASSVGGGVRCASAPRG